MARTRSRARQSASGGSRLRPRLSYYGRGHYNSIRVLGHRQVRIRFTVALVQTASILVDPAIAAHGAWGRGGGAQRVAAPAKLTTALSAAPASATAAAAKSPTKYVNGFSCLNFDALLEAEMEKHLAQAAKESGRLRAHDERLLRDTVDESDRAQLSAEIERGIMQQSEAEHVWHQMESQLFGAALQESVATARSADVGDTDAAQAQAYGVNG